MGKNTSTKTSKTETETKTETAAETETKTPSQVAVDLYASFASDETITIDQLKTAYKALPGGTRGKVLGQGMAAAMRKNPAASERILAAFDELQAPTKTEKPKVDPAIALADRVAGLQFAASSLLAAAEDSVAAKVEELLADGFDAYATGDRGDQVAPIIDRVLAAAKRGLSGESSARATSGKHGSQGLGHVSAWLAANFAEVKANESGDLFVSSGKIAGRDGHICEVKESPYYNDRNPSGAAIGNVLTGPKNNESRTGEVTVGDQVISWSGVSTPQRGLVFTVATEEGATE